MNCVNDELQELLEMNRKNAIKAEPDQPLKTYLAAYTLDRLKIVAGEQGLAGYSKMKKAEMVEALAQAVLSEERLSWEMIIMNEDEYQFLQDLAHGRHYAGEIISPALYGYACRLGYIYLLLEGDGVSYEMPHEVRALLLDIQTSEFLKQMADYRMKWTYICGLSNFYGMVKMADVVKLYNEYNEAQATEAEMERVLTLFSRRPQVTQAYEGYIINNFLLEDDEFERLSECIANQAAYYIPSDEEIVAYADDMYYEWTPELDKLEQYLTEAFDELDASRVHELVDDIQLSVVLEDDFQEIFDVFETYQAKFTSFEQVNEVSALITDVINNTRLWSNRGYTPKELHALNGTPLAVQPEIEAPRQQPIRVQKIGRNDPCPCGSGKKYKKCCGK